MEQEIHFCAAPDGLQLAYAIHGNGPPMVASAGDRRRRVRRLEIFADRDRALASANQ